MKSSIARFKLCAMILAIAVLQGCLKDTSTKTYTIYKPVYKTVAEVRSNIKSGIPQRIVHPGKIFVQGKYIFLNEVDKGVHVIDNTNPKTPVNKNFIAIPGNLELAVKDNILYADSYRDLIAIDISKPTAVQVRKITEKVFPQRTFLNGFAGDTSLVIVDWIKKDTTESLSDPMPYYGGVYYDGALYSSAPSPAPVGISGSMAKFTLLNNYLYTVTINSLNVFNIAQPENPVFSSSVNVGWNIETIFPFKGNLFIGSQTGMFIFSVANNPIRPENTSQFQHLTSCDPVIADDNYAYVTLRSGTNCNGSAINEVDILDIKNIQQPTFVKSYPLTNPHGLSKSGNTLFICDGTGGLKVYDATNVPDLKLLQTVNGINASDVIAVNNNAIVVTSDGVYQYSYADPAHLALTSKVVFNK